MRRELTGDLDWIVLQAMDRDRERRYVTPAALATDLVRYLASQPVEARPPTARYMVGRFVKRNPLGVALGVALALSLVSFGVVQGVLRAQVERARDAEVAARDAALRAAANERLLRESADSSARVADAARAVADANAVEATRQRETAEDERIRANEAAACARAALVQVQRERWNGVFRTRFSQRAHLPAFQALDSLSAFGGDPDVATLDPAELRELFLEAARATERGDVDRGALVRVIRTSHPTMIGDPQLFGLMAYLLEEVGTADPELAAVAQEVRAEVRETFGRVWRAPPAVSEDEALNRRVRVAGSAFRMQAHEVTNAEFTRFEEGHAFRPGAETHPVVGVT